MSIFFNVLFKTLGFFVATLLFFLIIVGISSYFNNQKLGYELVEGNESSENTIVILDINGPIVENDLVTNNFFDYNIISPNKIRDELNQIIEFKPKILIVSINSPGGTVSASNELYRFFLDFKNKTGIEIVFHASELLASGGYWSSLAGDKIYASYGSIIGSIGVKGPTWFFFNKPKMISFGFLGQAVEVQKEIEIYSTIAGQSKDLFNTFRRPTKNELEHLKNMVDKINEDFIQIVSKKRKLEKSLIKKEIGGLIFNSSQAKSNFLIDDEISLNELLALKIKKYRFKDFKIYKKINEKNIFLERLFTISSNKKANNDLVFNYLCNKVKTNIISLLSYSSIGC